ncbi:IclR family transcriptional regulator [Diaphorobacter sp. HDW4A]|uniref:IclR family transcriptional regulator n=1 Tax=Diaphorobacter sp. HDW4A TaxID=2714924 RepID=UPI00140913F3|nr:IclR family transcriptional regulator [Diaphorobacter sp. HDW4A]QIL79425.1 IclR family transcriptional regulator [Diaphorobacter sp. HDW4A]
MAETAQDLPMTSSTRVFAILNLFGEEHPIWHADEINEALGYTRATGYRYVKELVDAGFLRKASAGRYSLGPRIIELDFQLRRSDPVLLAAVPVADELAKQARLDAVLSTVFETRLVDTYRASADPALQFRYGRGRPRPLFQGAAPKVILAFMARAQLVKIYESCTADIAAAGLGTTWSEFRSRLTEIRNERFYWSRGELDTWLSGAAMPLFDADGDVAAALTLVGLNESMDKLGVERVKLLLERACEDIQASIAQGGLPHPLPEHV